VRANNERLAAGEEAFGIVYGDGVDLLLGNAELRQRRNRLASVERPSGRVRYCQSVEVALAPPATRKVVSAAGFSPDLCVRGTRPSQSSRRIGAPAEW
jgi:hypothetical protein